MPTAHSKHVLAVILLLALACDDKKDAKPAADAKASDAKADAKASDAKASDAKGEVKADAPAAAAYAAPASPCGLADLAPLDAGTPNDGSVEREGTDLVIPVCTYDLSGETINTFKLLVAVDDKADARYTQTEEVFASMGLGFVSEPVSSLGSKALYAVRLTAENQRIESTLALVDRDLYLELRFMGGGTKPWDAAAMRERMTKVATAAMTKLRKK
ncbi:MAG TPA: hypothetical protein VG755_30825 [Nannocystaceae bacterium]|nr:hypothetical protein [Nannocystaceae bacterium]